jgi:hypothetical protein
MTDLVNHPPHYKTHGVECIVAARGLGFDLGNAVKYVYRAWDKGDTVQDLHKARWYLRDFMTHGEAMHKVGTRSGNALRQIAQSFPPKGDARAFFFAIADELYGEAAGHLERMITVEMPFAEDSE